MSAAQPGAGGAARNLFDPELGPPTGSADPANPAADPTPHPEPDPRDAELEAARRREDDARREADRSNRLLERALTERTPPAAPEPAPEPWPDPLVDGPAYTRRIQTEGQRIVDQTTRAVDERLSRSEQRQQGERILSDFIDENPEYRGLGRDRIRSEFVTAMGGATEIDDPAGLKQRVSDRLGDLKKALVGDPAEGDPAAPAPAPRAATPPPAARTAGLRGGSRAPKAPAPKTDPAPVKSMVEDIESWQEKHGL